MEKCGCTGYAIHKPLAPHFRGGDAVEYITLILIIVLYTIIEIKK